MVSKRFPLAPLQYCLFTPELQWQSRGQRRISHWGCVPANYGIHIAVGLGCALLPWFSQGSTTYLTGATETARADAYGPWRGPGSLLGGGERRHATPFFDSLAKKGRVVREAYTPVPNTVKAIIALFCGFSPAVTMCVPPPFSFDRHFTPGRPYTYRGVQVHYCTHLPVRYGCNAQGVGGAGVARPPRVPALHPAGMTFLSIKR